MTIGETAFRYTVEEFDARGSRVEVLAGCQYIDAARAAYQASIAQFPDKLILLAQGGRMLDRNFDPFDYWATRPDNDGR
jgi:hypothetical protein